MKKIPWPKITAIVVRAVLLLPVAGTSMHNLRAVQVIMRLKSPHFHMCECQGANVCKLDGSAVSEKAHAYPC